MSQNASGAPTESVLQRAVNDAAELAGNAVYYSEEDQLRYEALCWLAAQLPALLADKARVDWLDEFGGFVECARWYWDRECPSARDAIDATMPERRRPSSPPETRG